MDVREFECAVRGLLASGSSPLCISLEWPQCYLLSHREGHTPSDQWHLLWLQLLTLQFFTDNEIPCMNLSIQTWTRPTVFLTLAVVKPCLLICG